MWQIVVAVVVSLASAAWSYKQMKKAQQSAKSDRAGVTVTRFGIDQAIPVLYGTRRLSPVIVYQGVKNVHTKDVKNETYFAILVWTIGPVNSIADLHFDDQDYEDFGSFTGTQRVEHLLGSSTQTMPDWFSEEAPDDMSGMHFHGLAVSFIKLAMDEDYKRYPQGRPEFSAEVSARTSNPVRVLEDYFTSTEYGLGFPASEWDSDFNDTMADYCDTVVDDHILMSCNIALDTEQPLTDNVKEVLQTCRGYMVDGDNGLRVEIDRQKDAVLHISEDLRTGGISTTAVDINDRYNQVTVRYPDRDLDWETNEVVYPESDSDLYAQWLAEDNNVPLTTEEEVEGIDNYEQALQYAQVLALLSRDGLTVELSVKSFIGWQVEEMDVVTVASQLRGWEAKPFSVRQIDYRESDTKLKLVEYQDSHFLWHSKSPKPDVPDTNLPNPQEVASPSGLSFALSDQPSEYGVLSWDAPEGYITGYDVTLTADGETVWEQATKTTSVSVPQMLSGTYQFAVRAVGALAVSGWSLLDASFVAPTEPMSVTVEAGNTYLILRPQSESLAFGTEYEFWFNDELRGTGVAWQMEGLQPETTYQFKVRAVNAVGESEFLTVSGTTTNDASVLTDILEGQVGQAALDDSLNQFLVQIEQTGQDNQSEIEATQDNLDGLTDKLVNLDRSAQDASQTAFNLASQVQNFTDEYERRLLEGESLVGAVVYRDAETGQIINKAYAYADQKYTEAGLLIDGVNASVTINAQELTRVETETDERMTEAEASITVNAGKIAQKASYSEVSSIVAGAIDAITPACSWHFNTSAEDWSGATWSVDGSITGTVLTKSSLSFSADDNPVVRIRLKGASAGTLSWNGLNQNVTIPAPSQSDEYETILITLSESDGWTGTVTSIELSLNAQIDFIEIGKSSASEVQLQDVTERVTTVEEELDAENARWSVYVTQDYWDTNALTLTDVNQEIDAFDAEWSVTATLQQLSDNGTLEKANIAAQWVDASESNITNVVAAYNAAEGGTDDQLDAQSSRLDTAEQQIDALDGEISQTVSSLTNVENALGDFETMDELMNSYSEFLRQGEFAQEQVALSYAEQKISAHSDELSAQAQTLLDLIAIKDEQQATLNKVESVSASNTEALAKAQTTLRAEMEEESGKTLSAANQHTDSAISTVEQSLAESTSNLQTEIENGDSQTLSAANQRTDLAFSTAAQSLAETKSLLQAERLEGDNETLSQAQDYTKTSVGYCVDADGNITSENDAVLCVAAGNSWVDGVLAQFIRNLTVSMSDGTTASVNQLAQAFVKKDGSPVARGGITTDVNGKISGFVNTNDGEDSTLDFIADHTRIGVLDKQGNFTSRFYLDAESKQLTLEGQLLLGDGYSVTGEDSIRALDGDTIYTEFQFSSNGSSWHFPEQSSDRYMRSRLVTNGTAGNWGATTDLKGTTGSTGAAGQDATERYTWIKYADDASGNGLSDSSTGKLYIGFAYNKTTPTESTTPTDYTWTLIKGSDGQDGAQGDKGDKGATGATGAKGETGATGAAGSSGAGFYTLTLRDGVFPTDATASADFANAYGRTPVIDDHLTYRNSTASVSATKRYNGSAWVAPTMLLHGDLLATGTVSGDRFKAYSEMTAPVISGGEFNGGQAKFGEGGPHDGYHTQITEDGTLKTNKLEATEGSMTNITIDESCTVKRLDAQYIEGDIYKAFVADVVKSQTGDYYGNYIDFYEFDIPASNYEYHLNIPEIYHDESDGDIYVLLDDSQVAAPVNTGSAGDDTLRSKACIISVPAKATATTITLRYTNHTSNIYGDATHVKAQQLLLSYWKA